MPSGLDRFPSREFTINQAWLTVTAIAADLIAWLRLLALTGDAADLALCEPKALRYRLLRVPAGLTHGQRRRRLRIPATWPWATAVTAVFANYRGDPSTRLTTAPDHHDQDPWRTATGKASRRDVVPTIRQATTPKPIGAYTATAPTP